ncbi:MAG TPA: hypothetical protein VFV72_01770 [Candidatus Limnocylindrales bacterium]|nr:hypothetical protein [Candidatus Limnocylindrales bacterium]
MSTSGERNEAEAEATAPEGGSAEHAREAEPDPQLDPNMSPPAPSTSVVVQTTDEPYPDPCVGILFVHGAGEHAIGNTLVNFGQPLMSWISGWLDAGRGVIHEDPQAIETGSGQLLVREADENAPAHVRVTVKPREIPHAWLLAESRWDEAFQPPSFREVVLWAIAIVPWTVLTQFVVPVIAGATNRRISFFWSVRFAWDFISSAVIGLVVAFLMQIAAVVVVILALIPVPSIRSLVGRLQRWLSFSVGDLFLVLTSPFQRAALSGAVQRDITWMRKQNCQKIVVIAHSQGGYVAHLALTDPWKRRVDRFITLGSGVIRLTEADRARKTGMLGRTIVGIIGLVIAIRSAIAFGTALARGTDPLIPFLLLDLGLILTVLLFYPLRQVIGQPVRIRELPGQTPWTDYLATSDPVVRGIQGRRAPEGATPVEVYNRASVLSDHSGYWANPDGFVSQVAFEVAGLDTDLDFRALGPVDEKKLDDHLATSLRQRQRRVGRLEAFRLAMIGATAVLLYDRNQELTSLGQPIANAITTTSEALPPQVSESWIVLVPFVTPAAPLIAAFAITLASLIWYRVMTSFWEAWSVRDAVQQWSGRPPTKGSVPSLLFGATFVLFLVAVGFAVLQGSIADTWRAIVGLYDHRVEIVQVALTLVSGTALLWLYYSFRWAGPDLDKDKHLLIWVGIASLIDVLVAVVLVTARVHTTVGELLLGGLFLIALFELNVRVLPAISKWAGQKNRPDWLQRLLDRIPRTRIGGPDTRLIYASAAVGVGLLSLLVTLIATGGLAHLAGAAAALAMGWAVLGLIDEHRNETRVVGVVGLAVSLSAVINAFIPAPLHLPG